MHKLFLQGTILFLSLAGAAAVAQEAPPIDDPGRASGKNQENIDPLLTEPSELVRHYSNDLILWPEEKGEKAAEAIYAGGRDTIVPLMEVLKGRDYRLKPGVAYLLSRFDCKEAFEPIRATLPHPRLKKAVKHLFASLYRLDEKKTLDLAVSLLSARERHLRKNSHSFLLTKDLGPCKEDLVSLLGSKEDDVRRHAFLLLVKSEVPGEELEPHALKLLGSNDPRLTDAARIYLAERCSADLATKLAAMVKDTDERRFAFAVLTLVTAENRKGEKLLPDEAKERLESLIDSRDPLLKVTAASGLTCLYLRRGSQEEHEQLRTRVVPAFMEVFLGGQYCKDFMCILTVAAGSLQRVTGVPFGTDLTFWKAWWTKHDHEYMDRQRLLTITRENIDRMILRYDRREGKRRTRFVLAGEAWLEDSRFTKTASTCFLSRTELNTILDNIFVSDLLQTGNTIAPDSIVEAGGIESGMALIEVAGEKRSHLVQYRVGENEKLDRLGSILTEIFRANVWQLLHSGVEFSGWYRENATWWRDQTTEPLRTRRFLTSFLDVFNLLSEDLILVCYDWLSTRDDLHNLLDPRESGDLLSRIQGRTRIDGLVRGTVRFIVAANARNLFNPLMTFLYTSFGESAFPLIAEVIEGLSSQSIALQDKRWFVRVAAAQALADKGESALPALINLLNDEDGRVRIEAFRSLARTECPGALDLMRAVVNRDEEEKVLELLTALCGLRKAWVYEIMELGAVNETARVRLAALEGLSFFHDEKTGALIKAVLAELGRGTETWCQAVRMLAATGGPLSRQVLLDLYAGTDDRAMRTLLALCLAELGSMTPMDHLLQLVHEGNESSEVREALAVLLVADFPDDAGKFSLLWEQHPGRDQVFFLMKALKLEPGDRAGPENRFGGVPPRTLVKALADSRWPVRSAAARVLEEGAGMRPGKVRRTTGLRELNTIRYSWEAWLESRGE